MKKFVTILLPLAAAAATVAARDWAGFKPTGRTGRFLRQPHTDYRARLGRFGRQFVEPASPASKIREISVRILPDNSQNARSAGQNALSRFRELYRAYRPT